MAQARQYHLVQLEYVDSIVKELISRMEAHNSYDDALVVVLADHGISFIPGTPRRSVTAENVGELEPVPLFFKFPHQQKGVIDDYRAETIDVLPTIANVLDVNIPWRTDGISLIDPARPPREGTTMSGPHQSATLDADGGEKLETVAYYQKYFGDRGPFGLAPDGYASLLGRNLEEFTLHDDPSIQVVIDELDHYKSLDPTGDPLPALLTGGIKGDVDGGAVLAVAFNGRIVALTRSWKRGSETRFEALIPPDAFAAHNDVQVLEAAEPGADQVLMLPTGTG